MYLNTNQKEQCCGCTACKIICPKACIEMLPDDEGFLYPVRAIKDCISCGLCENICPMNKTKVTDLLAEKQPLCFYGWMRELELRKLSTSGGAFVAIADTCYRVGIKNIFGAAYGDDLSVKHICIHSPDDLNLLRRSKYVQSELNSTYAEVLKLLKRGERVLFSGTPCQVKGLQNYVGIKYRGGLTTVALICHGVSSPTMFREYINELEKQSNNTVSSITFRDKKVIAGKLTHKCTTIHFKDGTNLESIEDPYTMMFGLGLINRPSCTECPFTTPYRDADISIGDFWGIEDIFHELSKELSNGVSLILSHTENGKSIVNSLAETFELHQAELQWALNPKQQQLIRPMKKNINRDRFMKSISSGGNFIKLARRELFYYKCKRSVCVRIRKLQNVIRGKRINEART